MENLMEKIFSLSKRRGFVFQGSEIYGGLGGMWDYGPIGTLLKNNIRESWLNKFVYDREDMFLIDAAIIMNQKVWQASGHAQGFIDLLVECKKCKERFKADQIKEKCPTCNGELSSPKSFNVMFKTYVGAVENENSFTYLRPETAQGIFVNFKNVIDTCHPSLPFGIAQIGKAFRNEINPRDFLFRCREFEQMEIEYFVKEEDWEKYFDYWKDEILEWLEEIGVDMNKVFDFNVPKEELAHYSKRTIDFEFEYPFGRKELIGLAYRGDFDLKNHSEFSKEKLDYLDKNGEKFIPHVIEPSFGLDRIFLVVLLSAYQEDSLGEGRIFLKLKPELAPFKIAVFPLLKNKPELVRQSEKVFHLLKNEFKRVVFDNTGNIGKNYRRQDEIGTPFCVTIDFETLDNEDVTVRFRDDGHQERIKISNLINFFKENLK